MNDFGRPFIPGRSASRLIPLGRYLPPLPSGMVTSWLRQEVTPGNWILDPLGTAPNLSLEAASEGYRVLVTCNNPILCFILEVLAKAPSKNDFQAVLAELSKARRGQERLEVHLQSLYLTECTECGQSIPVQAFLWNRDENQPFARLYHCPHCGDEGERPITQRDLERQTIPGSDKLHRSRALQRVYIGEARSKAGAEDALSTYLARPLYFLFTLINKVEGLSLSKDRKILLEALILSACDSGSSLWPWPSARSRPRLLITPPQFRENNLWLALEAAVQTWSDYDRPVPLTRWPNLPPAEGGICLFQGHFKGLLPLPQEVNPTLSISVFPRLSQAFWTLSALWSGWLWGPQAVHPLKSALERRRYDWQWHANALYKGIASLNAISTPEFPLFCILPEVVPGFLSAAMIATDAANFNLQGIALNQEQELAQLLWSSGARQIQPVSKQPIEHEVKEVIQDYLCLRNEPAQYLLLHAASLTSVINKGVLHTDQPQLPSNLVSQFHSAINQTFSLPGFLKRFESQSQSRESGMWWLVNTPDLEVLSLSDRIEQEVLHVLQEQSDISADELYARMCLLFQGLFTPSEDLVHACLESYGEPLQQTPNRWQLSDRETQANRQADILSVREMLRTLGQRLGYLHSGEDPLSWQSEDGQPGYYFYSLTSSIISRIVYSRSPITPSKCVLVFPGSRSKLLALKLQRDSRLAEEIASGWRFLKFRHLRRLIEREDITQDLWEILLGEDPPLWDEATQLEMFEKI